MSESALALRRAVAHLRDENLELRLALVRTTKQLAETIEEYRLLRVPFFRRWRLRRLRKRQAENRDKERNYRLMDDHGSSKPEGVEEPAVASEPPLIIVPGR
jgi:hypothetical protein